MEYTFSVARVRAKEAALLSAQDMEQLIAADTYEDALRILRDKGYSEDGNGSVTARAETELWEFLGEIADGELIKLLRLPVDYHNIKASVKASYSNITSDGLLLDNGNLDKELIDSAVRNRNFDDLPEYYGSNAQKVTELILRTHDGQRCDMSLDKALLAATEASAEKIGDSFIIKYSKMNTDLANLKSALRCALTDKNESFIYHAVYKGGTLNRVGLIEAAANGLDSLYSFVEGTAYSEGVTEMKKSTSAFEKWCDDKLMSLMDEARYESFSAAPVMAYAYAKKAEIAAVRLILSAKKNKLDKEILRERVRRLYV